MFEGPCIPWLPAELLAFSAASRSPSGAAVRELEHTWGRGPEV